MQVRHPLSMLLAGCIVSSHLHAQEPVATGIIRGVVVVSDGAPLEKVSVRVVDTGQTAITGSDGRFEMTAVPVGPHELIVSAVDLVRVRQTISVFAGAVLELKIPIAEGTGAFNERVDVSAAAVPPAERAIPAQDTLGRRDLQQLRGLMTNDPFRAIHALPGVTNSDDLYSEFAVRGLFTNHLAFTFEGIATPLVVHTVHGVQDGGSVAMVNGDILDGISLSLGSYPQLFGNRIGSQLDFRLREGSRDGLAGHVSVSMTDASAVAEGPIGAKKSGSWLVSFRQSYLERLLRTIYPEDNFGFGFSDAQTKVVYDLSPSHQIQIALTAGHSRLQQRPQDIGVDDVKDGTHMLSIGVATWRFAPSRRFALTQRFGITAETFENVNRDEIPLANGRGTDLLYRADWTRVLSPLLTLQGGGEARRSVAREYDLGFSLNGNGFLVRDDFGASGVATSAYALADLRFGRSVVTPGARIDHSSVSSRTTVSPWIQANHSLGSRLLLRGGAGMYRQEPGLAELRGLRGDPALDAERAYHVDAGVEGFITKAVSWQVTGFEREDRDLLRLPHEIRLLKGVPAAPPPLSRYRNALDGHSRGIDVLVRRRSPNGLSGWLGYTFAVTRYRDQLTGEAFYGDFDQRHTLNAYGVYRHSDRMSFSARFRAGSNFPAAGYWTARDDAVFLGTTKNDVRVPAYSRLDLRANRTFDWGARRLTMFAEVLNAYNRENVRAGPPAIVGLQHQVFGLFDSMFPIIPSVGLMIDF